MPASSPPSTALGRSTAQRRRTGRPRLYLEATDFGTRDPSKPAAQTALWLQYLLDQAATVQEALALMDGIQLVKITVNGTTRTSTSRWRTRAGIRRSSNSPTAAR